MTTVHCLVCDKPVALGAHDELDGAGFLDVTFHYGSRHDMCLGYPGPRAALYPDNASPRDTLLRCDQVEGYLCDDCFEKRAHRLRGYDKENRTTRTLRVG